MAVDMENFDSDRNPYEPTTESQAEDDIRPSKGLLIIGLTAEILGAVAILAALILPRITNLQLPAAFVSMIVTCMFAGGVALAAIGAIALASNTWLNRIRTLSHEQRRSTT